ncbi:hypothetical protein GSI_06341 [Ganoderma sinense ZZ0214-1]|uniref:Uncharacterized protein n=1 Tax=Ganoderma sinense ZZ0214-1 TaxID=1077348 RepID=A0A2G8SCZ8_9APHY|nr:hypothetical protein GSI_06341 [Ganoderma sinense ZZ0214-1]
MADQSFSATFPNPSNKPSSMEGAFASLGFDPPPGPVSLCHTHTRQVLDAARSASSPRMQPITRHHSVNNNAAVNLDPVPGDPDCLFIRPPFTDYPGSEKQKTGLTYNILAAHPDWFLDVNDFIGSHAVVYPPQLEPPRGWCPTKKKDAKDGWKEGEEPRLRCTLCRRQYAGVNAKSMWRRHVYEKHKIAMANRRETNDRPSGRGARSSNKENKAAPKPPEKDLPGRTAPKAIRRVISLEVGTSASHAGPSIPFQNTFVDNTPEDAHHSQSSGEEEPSLTEGPSFSGTPPQTPGVSSSDTMDNVLEPAFDIVVPPESPYNPLMTPAFRHSPARLPVRQPWKFSSPRVGQEVRDYTLAMLARVEASPNVRGLDVSPIVLVPASERQKRSIFSPPRRRSLLSMSPRQLFPESDENDSIQSRFDQPGWEVPTTPGLGLPPYYVSTPNAGEKSTLDYDLEDIIRGLSEAKDRGEEVRPLSPPPSLHRDLGIMKTPSVFKVWDAASPQYTPHTKMFINGIISPAKDPNSSPCPSCPASPSASNRSRRASVSNGKAVDLSAAPLLSPFAGKEDSNVITDDPIMDIDDISPHTASIPAIVHETPAKSYSKPSSWQDVFGESTVRTPGDGDSRRLLSASTSSTDSGFFSTSGASSSRLVLSASTSSSFSQGRRVASPSRSRARSASNAGSGSSGGSSGGHKHTLGTSTATVGLMDAILDKKTRRRKHSQSEHRGADGEVGVTAFGSPFKMGRKTSRKDFLYSLDGDCEMQDTQPRKRRKTISGFD